MLNLTVTIKSGAGFISGDELLMMHLNGDKSASESLVSGAPLIRRKHPNSCIVEGEVNGVYRRYTGDISSRPTYNNDMSEDDYICLLESWNTRSLMTNAGNNNKNI